MTASDPFALYVHIPFCTAKCTYCDFNSYAGQDSLMAAYTDAVVREAGLWAHHLAGRKAETVFFGGGTPSLLPIDLMERIVAALRDRFDLDAAAEISLEANPGSVDLAHLEGLRAAGFNRISFGVQSFHDEELRQLERIHDAHEVEDAVGWAGAAGFENINLDLIYGLAGQSLAAWKTNLETGLALTPAHLSLYALTLEEGTPLTRDVGRGRSAGPDLDLQADMFEWSRERLAAAGFRYYEVSNWARPGRECRHNLVYWRNGDWLGLGAGAHSHLAGERFAAAASPSRYIGLIENAQDEPAAHENLRLGEVTERIQPSGRAALAPTSTSAASLSHPSEGRLIENAQDEPAAHENLRLGEIAEPKIQWMHGAQVPEVQEATPPAGGIGGAPQPLTQPEAEQTDRDAQPGAAALDTMPQITFREPADRAREMSETVILALRLREGLDLATFERRFCLPFEAAFAAPLQETLELGLTELVEDTRSIDGRDSPDHPRGEPVRGASRLRLRDEAVLLGDEAFLRFLPERDGG